MPCHVTVGQFVGQFVDLPREWSGFDRRLSACCSVDAVVEDLWKVETRLRLFNKVRSAATALILEGTCACNPDDETRQWYQWKVCMASSSACAKLVRTDNASPVPQSIPIPSERHTSSGACLTQPLQAAQPLGQLGGTW